jgi:hypothetical protein
LTLCRYNEFASTPPLCPPSACIMSDDHF